MSCWRSATALQATRARAGLSPPGAILSGRWTSSSTPASRHGDAPPSRPSRARSRRACARARSTRSSARSTCSGRAAPLRTRDRAGAPALDGPLRAAGHGQDDDRADRRDRRRTRRSRSSAPSRPAAPRCARCSSAPTTGARAPASRRSSSSTRSTASTRPSRTRCCPAVEEGLVTLIGATTENPYFEVNSALLSRTQVYELRALSAADVEVLLRRALDRGECGAARGAPTTSSRSSPRAPAATRARRLAALELACETAPDGEPITLERAEDALQRRARPLRQAAATTTTTRSRPGSRRRAARTRTRRCYYLAVMIEGGEDPRFIARRMVILASEDVGNADPQALQVAVAAAHAVEHVGHARGVATRSPSARSTSRWRRSRTPPASRSARARALRARARRPAAPALPAERGLPGRGEARARRGYDYPHDNPAQVSDQELLPDRRRRARASTTPGDAEAALRERLERGSAGRAGGRRARPTAVPSAEPARRRLPAEHRSPAGSATPCGAISARQPHDRRGTPSGRLRAPRRRERDRRSTVAPSVHPRRRRGRVQAAMLRAVGCQTAAAARAGGAGSAAVRQQRHDDALARTRRRRAARARAPGPTRSRTSGARVGGSSPTVTKFASSSTGRARSGTGGRMTISSASSRASSVTYRSSPSTMLVHVGVEVLDRVGHVAVRAGRTARR